MTDDTIPPLELVDVLPEWTVELFAYAGFSAAWGLLAGVVLLLLYGGHTIEVWAIGGMMGGAGIVMMVVIHAIGYVGAAAGLGEYLFGGKSA